MSKEVLHTAARMLLAGLGLASSGCEWQVERSVSIDAPPARVWQVLTTLEDYPRWNTYSPRAEGELRVGGVVEIDARLGDEVQVVENRITVLDPGRTLCWHSMNWFEFLVRGTRCRHLEPEDAGGTRFRHHEIMEGPLATVVEWVYRPLIEAGLERMNADLKRAAETTP